MRRFWIDSDTASDDTVAILMALRWPDVHVESISIVAGNVPTEQGTVNALYTVELCGGAVCTVGNITPAAEYNIWCDPEAARILFRSGMKTMMIDWEHCRGQANLDDEMDQR